MKKIAIFSLILSIGGAFGAENSARSFFCEEAYKAKFEKIEKHRFLRKAGKVGVIAGFAVGGLMLPTLWVGPLRAISGAFIYAPMGGSLGAGVGDLIDRESGLVLATEFFSLSGRDREELKKEVYKKYILEKQAFINYIQETHYTQEEIEAKFPIENYKLNTIVDMALEDINKKRVKRNQSELTYQEFQQELVKLHQTDAFCPTNRRGRRVPQTYRQVLKISGRYIP